MLATSLPGLALSQIQLLESYCCPSCVDFVTQDPLLALAFLLTRDLALPQPLTLPSASHSALSLLPCPQPLTLTLYLYAALFTRTLALFLTISRAPPLPACVARTSAHVDEARSQGRAVQAGVFESVVSGRCRRCSCFEQIRVCIQAPCVHFAEAREALQEGGVGGVVGAGD